MESALSKACVIKIENFEGPFDLLYHLIEKNKMNIYDIPINQITDQYLDYLFAMEQMDLEIASEFLVIASTLLHIKSKLLLPQKKEEKDKDKEEDDPRKELISKLIEYKKYKTFANELKEREEIWEKVFYKPQEDFVLLPENKPIRLSEEIFITTYLDVIRRYKERKNKNAKNVERILESEKVTIGSKVKEIVRILIKKTSFIFNELFSRKKKSRVEIVTAFMAILELAKIKKIKLEQNNPFGEINIHKIDDLDKIEIDFD